MRDPKSTLKNAHAEQDIPVNKLNFSWGSSFPSPPSQFANAFLTLEMHVFNKSSFKTRNLPDLLSEWMRQAPDEDRYLLSLNPEHYLVATSGDVQFQDVFTVYKTWDLDS